jgi:hypothetical protein
MQLDAESVLNEEEQDVGGPLPIQKLEVRTVFRLR